MEFIASLPNWAIIALACGVTGGLAGLIGGLMERSGMKWGRFLPVFVIAATVALANNGGTNWVRSQAMSPQAAGALLKATDPQLYGLLETAFPEDYAQLTAHFADIAKGNGTTDQKSTAAAESMAQIRRKYAPLVGLASDEELEAIVASNIQFYEALIAVDPMLCNTVALSGPIAIVNHTGLDEVRAMVQPQAFMVLQAAAHGASSPTPHRAVTDADWAEVLAAMNERGATEAQVAAIGAMDTKSPDLCPGLVVLLKTLNDVDTEAVKAVRAQFLIDVSAA